MAIVCVHCGQSSDKVLFLRPAEPPKALRPLKVALLVAGLLSVISMSSLFGLVVTIVRAAVIVEAAVVGSAEASTPELRDYVRISSNTAVILAIAFVAVLGVVAFRYLALFLRGLRRGRPSTWSQIRVIAWTQLAVEAFGALLVVLIFSRTEVVKVTPSLGWGLVTAPVLLWLTSRPTIRAYFSRFRIEAAPAVKEPVPEFVKGPGHAA
ncbi:MAG TPA: hypothetical protein VI818_08480 [Candidatus Thermoplasmatota archaeon]|nr:hypothetical protein [Candidatus Thermoplasmatota archaeon]